MTHCHVGYFVVRLADPMLCCAVLQFTEMVMGHRKSEGVASPRGTSSAAAALNSKAAEATEPAANGHAKDDTAMVN